jgi:hypothetical protein
MGRGEIIAMIINHLPAINCTIEEIGFLFFLVIWQLINYSIDTKWIMSKEFVDGSLDYTSTLIRGYPGGRVLYPPLRFQSCPDVYI